MSELHDLIALIRANTPLIVVETQEEARTVELFRQALAQVWRALYRWSVTEGLRRIDIDREDEPEGAPDASAALHAMKNADQRGIYLLLDFHPYLGYAAASASCATSSTAATASRTWWCWSARCGWPWPTWVPRRNP